MAAGGACGAHDRAEAQQPKLRGKEGKADRIRREKGKRKENEKENEKKKEKEKRKKEI